MVSPSFKGRSASSDDLTKLRLFLISSFDCMVTECTTMNPVHRVGRGGGGVVYQYTRNKFAKIPQNTQNSSKYSQNYTQVYFIPETQRRWYTEYQYLSCNIPYTLFKKPLYTVYPKTLADSEYKSPWLMVQKENYCNLYTIGSLQTWPRDQLSVNTKKEISNPEQIKCHTDPRFIIFDSPIHNPFNEYLLKKGFKVQDIHFLFSKSIPFTFFAFLSFEVPMWSTRLSHPKVTTPRK